MGWNLSAQGQGEALGGAEVSQGECIETEDWWASFCLMWHLPDRPRASLMEPPGFVHTLPVDHLEGGSCPGCP